MAGKIFINYRRGDDPGFTQALYLRLEDEFGADNLFMDVEGHIKPGDDFVHVLDAQVAASDIVLAVIGPRWAELMAQRQGDPDDFVAIEIQSALDRKKRVIPVLVNGAPMPKAETLPESIRKLARRNAVGLRPDRFKADVQGLVTALKEQLVVAEAERNANTEAERAAAAAAEADRRHAEEAAANRAAELEQRRRSQAQAGLTAEQIAKAEELANWDYIKESSDPRDFRDHLARFPKGVVERNVLAKLEEVLWKAILNADPDEMNGGGNVRAFLDEFPNGKFAAEARVIVEKSRVRQQEAADKLKQLLNERKDFAEANRINTAPAMKAFLEKWPSGENAAAARARLKELRSGGRFSRRALLKGVALGGGATAAAGGTAYFMQPGKPLWSLVYDQSVRTFVGDTYDGARLPVNSVAFSPGGKTALSGSGGTLRSWDVATGGELRTFFRHKASVSSAVFSPDGKSALIGHDNGNLSLWDVETGQELRKLPDRSYFVTCVAVSPDGTTALVGGAGTGSGRLELVDIAAGKEIHGFGVRVNISAVAFSPSSKTAISGGYHSLQLWDLKTGTELRSFPVEGEADSVAFAPDGKTILSGGFFRECKLWDAETGKELRSFAVLAGIVKAVAFSPDGKTVLTGGDDNAVQIWDGATGQEIRKFTGHTERVNSVAYAPDGKFAISGSSDGTMKLWDLTR